MEYEYYETLKIVNFVVFLACNIPFFLILLRIGEMSFFRYDEKYSGLNYLCNMDFDFQIVEPVVFNPIKHHLEFMKEFIYIRSDVNTDTDIKILIKELKHIGTSVMDVYTGSLSVEKICKEIKDSLYRKIYWRKKNFPVG